MLSLAAIVAQLGYKDVAAFAAAHVPPTADDGALASMARIELERMLASIGKERFIAWHLGKSGVLRRRSR